MFTGIIKETGVVTSVQKKEGGVILSVGCQLAPALSIDESVNINGVCHTVIDGGEEVFKVRSVEETLRKTNIGELQEQDRVNLEPSLHPEQLLDGHLVQGHVDTTGTVKAVEPEGTDHLFTISIPSGFNNLIVNRGSIAVDGVSLTIAKARENNFTAAVIPYSFEHTNLQDRQPGEKVNLEFDILGKYVARYMENRF